MPFDYYYLSDLADGLKKDYDVYIVEAVNVGEEERFAIERYLKRAGKTIVWLGLTGIYDEEGKVSERAMSELIGMDVAFTEGGTYAVTVEDNGHYAAAGLDGFVYGNPASVGKVTPMAYVADQDATALGSFDPLGRTGLAVKEVPVSAVDGWTSVYSAVGNVPAELIRNILEHKGANVYTDSGDVVFANSGYLAVDSPYGGARTLNLGGTYDVYDVFVGSMVATGVSSFTAHFDAGGTRLFRLTPSSANPQPEPDPQPKPDPPENKATVWPYVLAGGTAAALAAVVAVAIVLKKEKNKKRRKNMKMKKRILSVALALALGLSAAGCSKNDDAFELQIFAGGYGTEMWEYVLELFEEDHPDVKIVTYMDSNANNRLAERWRQGNPPDFVFLEGEGLDRDGWLANDLLYDCTEWLKTAKVNGSDKLITEVADLGMFNRHTNSQGDEIIYGLPLLKNSYGVWYDQNWFEKNNLTFPKSYTALMEFGEEVRTKKSDGGAAAATMIYPADNAAGYLVQGFILPALALTATAPLPTPSSRRPIPTYSQTPVSWT